MRLNIKPLVLGITNFFFAAVSVSNFFPVTCRFYTGSNFINGMGFHFHLVFHILGLHLPYLIHVLEGLTEGKIRFRSFGIRQE